jgi:hypothetical protein
MFGHNLKGCGKIMAYVFMRVFARIGAHVILSVSEGSGWRGGMQQKAF